MKKTTKKTTTTKKAAPKKAAPKKVTAKKAAPKKAVKKQTASSKIYHVAKRAEDGKWTVKFASGEKVIKTFATKVEAEEYAKTMAKNQGGSVRTHASKGKNKGKLQ